MPCLKKPLATYSTFPPVGPMEAWPMAAASRVAWECTTLVPRARPVPLRCSFAVQRAQPAAHLVPLRGGWGKSKEPKAQRRLVAFAPRGSESCWQPSTRRGQPGHQAALTGPPTAALTAYLAGYLPWGGEGGARMMRRPQRTEAAQRLEARTARTFAAPLRAGVSKPIAPRAAGGSRFG